MASDSRELRVEPRTRGKMALRVAARSARQLRYAPVLTSTVRGMHSSPSSRGVCHYLVGIVKSLNLHMQLLPLRFQNQLLQTRHSRDMLKPQKSCTTMAHISCSVYRNLSSSSQC